jgi:two-component system sensor histidine kinase KdpD
MDVEGLRRQARGSIPRAVAVAIAFPAAVTVVGVALSEDAAEIAVAGYLLGVVLAAIVGGLFAGVLAAVISAVALLFFLQPPRFSWRVASSGDVVAAIVMLAVAILTGLLVTRLLDARDRATAREREATLLATLSARLLSGETPEFVLQHLAASMVEPLGLSRCSVTARFEGRDIEAEAEGAGAGLPGARRVAFPIDIGGVSFGSMIAESPPGARPLGPTDIEVLGAASRQAAVALERARLGDQVRGALLEAETSRMRAAMFSSVTHDLRTPLAVIKASVTGLLDPDATYEPAQERELLSTVLEETDRLDRLVGNIMDLARIRSGTLVPAREPIALDELVASVLGRLRHHLAGHEVRTLIREDVPEIDVDPVQADQVLTNLLENAARHAPAGSVITISAAPVHDVVEMRVADRGPGIAPEDRERVFEAFFRGDGAKGGRSGLGLAIAKAIVDAHGGTIAIEGAPGGGTVVAISWPVWNASAEGPPVREDVP